MGKKGKGANRGGQAPDGSQQGQQGGGGGGRGGGHQGQRGGGQGRGGGGGNQGGPPPLDAFGPPPGGFQQGQQQRGGGQGRGGGNQGGPPPLDAFGPPPGGFQQGQQQRGGGQGRGGGNQGGPPPLDAFGPPPGGFQQGQQQRGGGDGRGSVQGRGGFQGGPPPLDAFGPPPGGHQQGQQQRGGGGGRGWGGNQGGPPPLDAFGPPPGGNQQGQAQRGRGAHQGQRGGGQGGPQPHQQQQQAIPPVQEQQQRRESTSSVTESVKSLTLGTPSEAGSSASAKAASEKSLELLPITQRKDPGQKKKKSGRPILVDVNHMELKLANWNITAYHYDIVFTPDKPKYLLRPAIEKFFKQKCQNHAPCFDGLKNVFTNGPLDKAQLSGEVSVFNDETQRDKTIVIEMAEVGRIDMKHLLSYHTKSNAKVQMPLLVLDVALRALSASKFVQSGRRYFTAPRNPDSLTGGLELWHGHYQSAVLGWKPYLCVDISNTAFFKEQSIEKVILEVCDRVDINIELDRYAVEALTTFIKGIKVDYEIPKQPSSRRTYRVLGVVGPASKETFLDDQKKKWTIAEYYQGVKSYRLCKSHLPCIWVGSQDRKIYLPAELCKIAPNQSCNRKLDEMQTRNMVQRATTDTNRRRDNIMHAYKQSGMADANPFMKEFGISVSGQFERVEGRILEPPKLQYDKNSVMPAKGVWRASQFLKASKLPKWAILSLDRNMRDNDMRKIENQMIAGGSTLGMTISTAFHFESMQHRIAPNDPKLISFFQNMKQNQVDLVFVIVPNRGETYSYVKSTAEISVGMLTQCIKAATVQKLNPATVGNILLKVNAKLDGLNHRFMKNPEILNKPIMIVGADVTHPAPGQQNSPSIAAVAASHDPTAFKYNMIWRMQPKGEMIADLKNIMIEHLKFFYVSTRVKPEKVIFFRDGVSEGEIQKVMSQEISAIRAAFASMGAGTWQPPITFLVVQKRHHTRFFPVDERDIYDRKNFNLPAGTVVDTDIVHPHETEFILLSHASILGTARPTKYRLVWDENGLSDEKLEELSFYLCHMFTRCTRSVSYPAPTYYAHLAAFRARHYIEGRLNFNNLEFEQSKRTLNPELVKKNPMFFV